MTADPITLDQAFRVLASSGYSVVPPHHAAAARCVEREQALLKAARIYAGTQRELNVNPSAETDYRSHKAMWRLLRAAKAMSALPFEE